MALNNNTNRGTYLKIKDGKLYKTTDKELTTPFTDVTGRLVDIYHKMETYEGKPNQKLYIVLEDDERYILGVGADSSWASSFLSFIMNVDLAKPIMLAPSEKEIEGKQYKQRSLLVSQNGAFAKGYFTKATPNGLPEMEKVTKRGGIITWNRDAILDFYEDLVKNTIKPKLSKNEYVVTEQVVGGSQIIDETETELEEVDDLPF